MSEDFSQHHIKVACGQYHSAFIGISETESANSRIKFQRLFVWGQNDEGQLSDKIEAGQEHFNKKIDKPTQIQLKYGQREYEAMSVVAGPSYNLILGQINLDYEKTETHTNKKSAQKQKWIFKQPLLMPDDHQRLSRLTQDTRTVVEKIRRIFKRNLYAKGTLANLFEPINRDEEKDQRKDQDAKMQGYNKRKGGYSQFYQEDRGASTYKPGQNNIQNMNANQQPMLEQDPSQIIIERSEFQELLQDREITSIDVIQTVTDVLFENSSEVSLQQLEDFALGFQQDATKLFMYGKVDNKLASFTKKLPIINPSTSKALNQNKGKDDRQFDQGTSSESSEEDQVPQTKMQIITRPTVVTFPKFCPKIVQVSCGVGHILALTSHHEMYSWGNGEYGALGFGTIVSIEQPTNLQIRQNNMKLPISKVECGSLHSMCVTMNQQIFTWGCGKQGRLGHGNEDDVLIPTEIVKLSQRRVCQISAGESHCAAITQAGKVYLWGNGSYGRLGTGFEFQMNTPELIDDLTNKEIVRVSCGAFHTLCLSKDGNMYSFGQNKYGKLGLNVRKENTVFRSTHTQIHPYKLIQNLNDNKIKIEEETLVKFRQIIAGYNHSMAITKNGRVYSWGYSGFGLLGRDGVQNIPIAIESGYQNIKKYFIRLPVKDLSIKFSGDSGAAQVQNVNQVSIYSTKITKVQCVSLGTMVLTDKGEIHYAGDNRYGQLPVEEDKNNDHQKGGDEIFKQIDLNKRVVKDISCGGDHIFAVTIDDKVWAWGRNDSAQLGIGLQQDYVNSPTEVPAFREIAVTKIVCGQNYSAAITSSHRLMVAGSLEYGKLGLGTNQRSGYQQEFQVVSKLRSVKNIACGPTHMIAIVDRNASQGCGVFAWGNNSMGQLGTDNTESSYRPREISLKKSERFDEICAGLDFSLGLARHSRKVYMWGNIKYYGSSTSTQNQMHKAPILIKDLESEKIKHIFCSQTYAYVITESDEIKAWGEWFYERTREYQGAGIDQEDDDGDQQNNDYNGSDDAEEDESDDDDSDEDDSNDESDDDLDYQSDEQSDDSNYDQKRRETAKRRKNDQTKDFHQIYSFHRTNKDQDIRLRCLAFGTNHAAAINHDGLLYTWGHNEVQQLGVRNVFEQHKDETISKEQRLKELNKLQSADINKQLKSNLKKLNEETFGQAIADQLEKDDQEELEQEEDEVNALLGADETGIGATSIMIDRKTASGKPIAAVRDQDDEPPGKEVQMPAEGTLALGLTQQNSVKKVQWQDTKDMAETVDATGPEQVLLIEKQQKSAVDPVSKINTQVVQKKEVLKVRDFPQVKVEKLVRIKNTDNPIEMKTQLLQNVLKQEKKRTDEESLFVIDKSINDSLTYLHTTLSRLPAIDQQRRKLKIMIKNAFLQRIQEKPLNVPPVIDFDKMTVQKINQKNKRRQKKANLQQVLNILQQHPCYFQNLYFRCKELDWTVSKEELLEYLKNIYPSQCYSNQQFGPLNPKLDHTPMVSREQERVNLLQISFIKHIIKSELEEFKSLDKVDFLSKDSLIGRLFFRIFKSQEKNVDTICSILAHLLNKFIAKLQESTEFDNTTTSKGKTRDNAGKDSKGKQENEAADQHSPGAIQMYRQFLDDLIIDLLENKILTQQNANFQLKHHWLNDDESNGEKFVPSLRFSSEVSLLIEIILTELNEIESQKRVRPGHKEISHEFYVAQKIMGLVFYRMIKKISADKDTLLLYLYPYLRETKKQILIEEGMEKHGEKYLELCKVINYFLSDTTWNVVDQEQHWIDFKEELKRLRQDKLIEIFQSLKKTNHVQPKLLAMKHFEAAFFHSLSPYDFQLSIKKQSLINLFTLLYENKEHISLMSPASNDQLFRLFGSQTSASDRNNSVFKKEFIGSLKTYPDKFNMKIPSRMFVKTSNATISKCKDCQTVLTDEFVKLEAQPIIDQYEPEDKESLVSVYCDILRQIPNLDPKKNIAVQFKEISKQSNHTMADQQKSEKIKEFKSQLDREIQLIKQNSQDNSVEQNQQILEDFEQLKGTKIYDWNNFKQQFQDPGEDNIQREKVQIASDGLAYVEIIEDVILQGAQTKINERITHKNVSTVLQRRMQKDLKNYLDQTLENMIKNEIFQLKIQLYNVQLGIGNLELRKLTKITDQMQQMSSIISQQKNQHYSQVLYRVLPDSQKMLLRAIVQKRARDLIKNRTITEIKISSLRTMINDCKLLVMEDEANDVLVKLLFEQKSMSCFCFNKTPMENLLLQFHLSQQEIVEMRKMVKAYQIYVMHVNVAFDSYNTENQRKVCEFAAKMAGQDEKQKDKKKRGDQKGTKKKVVETREAALQLLSVFNKRTFKDCIEFDLTKLIELINDMLKTRYAYVFNSDKSPEQLLSQNAQQL